jgi:hypothetical protein
VPLPTSRTMPRSGSSLRKHFADRSLVPLCRRAEQSVTWQDAYLSHRTRGLTIRMQSQIEVCNRLHARKLNSRNQAAQPLSPDFIIPGFGIVRSALFSPVQGNFEPPPPPSAANTKSTTGARHVLVSLLGAPWRR